MASLIRSLIVLAFFSAVSSAIPYGNWDCQQCEYQRDSTPTLPLREVNNTGATPLPSPTGTLKYIELGLGFQNYTCNATASTPTGTWIQSTYSAGAIADLYDITRYVNSQTGDSFSKNTLKSFERCLEVTSCTPSPGNNYCEKCHDVAAAGYKSNQNGLHFFMPVNGAQTPNFNLYGPCDFLSAKRSAGVKAPVAAYDGENNLGAIDWLYLIDNGSGLTKGLKSVYRVETAGGVAPSSCTGPASQTQIPYAAEYWFYD